MPKKLSLVRERSGESENVRLLRRCRCSRWCGAASSALQMAPEQFVGWVVLEQICTGVTQAGLKTALNAGLG